MVTRRIKKDAQAAKSLLLNHECEWCGNPNATHRTDPYAEDVRGDYAQHWICENCLDQLSQDI